MCCEYYKKLFAAPVESLYDIEQYCYSVTVPVLSVDEADICEGFSALKNAQKQFKIKN